MSVSQGFAIVPCEQGFIVYAYDISWDRLNCPVGAFTRLDEALNAIRHRMGKGDSSSAIHDAFLAELSEARRQAAKAHADKWMEAKRTYPLSSEDDGA